MNTIKQITTEQSRNTPEGWVETTLGEVAKINLNSIDKNYSFDEVLYLDTGSITKGKIEELQTFNLVDAPSRAKRLVKDGDIVYSTVRPNQEHYGFIRKPERNLVVSTGFTVITSILINPKFLFYCLTQSSVTNYLQILAEHSTSTYPSIKSGDIENLEFNIPKNLDEQKAIASILTAFDDKIELLQAQNKTLEETAQTIFKEWFGKYQIGDELPDGWRIFQLSELVVTINGYSYKGSELVEKSDDALVTLKSFDRNGGFQTRGFKPFLGNPKANQEVEIGDLIVAHTDLTQDADVLGNPAFIFDDGGFKKMYITMDLVKVLPIHKDISSSFLYYLMKDKAFKGHCVGYSNGTTVLHLSKKAISEYQLFLPIDFNLIKRFSELADSTTTKISLNKITIKSLYETRDELLPRLMSGEIRVNDFKEHVA